MEAWTKLIVEAKPPVPNTPLSPYALPYQLEKHGCALDGSKIKQVSKHGISLVPLAYPDFLNRSSAINSSTLILAQLPLRKQ
jgi:hypothetical protein